MWLQEIRQRHLTSLSSVSLKGAPCVIVVGCHSWHGTAWCWYGDRGEELGKTRQWLALCALCFQKPRKTMAVEAVRDKDSPLDLLEGARLCWHLADLCPQNPERTNACRLQPAGCAVLLLRSSETKAYLTCAKSLQSCLILCDPMDHSPPGSSVHGILQARILEWIAMPSFRGSSQPRARTRGSCISCTGRWVLYH